MKARNRLKAVWRAIPLVVMGQSCHTPSYQLALYEGAERLADGPHFEYQKTRKDCGVAAALMMLRFDGQRLEYAALRQEVSVSRDGLSLEQIRELMLRHHLAVAGLRVDPSNLDGVSMPLIAWLPTQHVVVLEAVTPVAAIVSDPGRGRWKVSRAELARAWDGTALVPVGARPSVQAVRSPTEMRSDTIGRHLTRGSY
jgi:ATP-binding cassette subfamily B protein RaxB